MTFLKSFLGALLALVVFSGICLILFIGFLSGIQQTEKVIVADNSVLVLDLDGEITELETENILEGLPAPLGALPTMGLVQLKQAISHARSDSKINGILLRLKSPVAGFSTLQEIRDALGEFKDSGKWVVAYADVYSESAYYLASVADEVYLNPAGDFEFNGLTVQVTFYKKLFDKLEVKPEVFRVGEFKSAVEPFLFEEMSTENRLQLTELVTGIYDNILNQISQSRDIPYERLKEISSELLVHLPQDALEFNLVDSLFYQDQLRARLANLTDKEEASLVSYTDYKTGITGGSVSSNEVAVLVAEGTIISGPSEGSGTIGSETFIKEIRRVRENDRIKAVVLRINSPGGEFQASDLIWREIKLTAEKKPVIASMSDYAASGGYYIAMGCDTIVSNSNTITGSIGIYGVLFDLSGLLENKIGITFDEVRTGKFGELYSVTRPLSDGEKRYWQHNLDVRYEEFITKAAMGRALPLEKIQENASGRVWTGTQAQSRSLVDVLGNLDDAIQIAAGMANLEEDNYRVKYYPRPKSLIEQLFSSSSGVKLHSETDLMEEQFRLYQQIKKITMYGGVQARMPFEMRIY